MPAARNKQIYLSIVYFEDFKMSKPRQEEADSSEYTEEEEEEVEYEEVEVEVTDSEAEVTEEEGERGQIGALFKDYQTTVINVYVVQCAGLRFSCVCISFLSILSLFISSNTTSHSKRSFFLKLLTLTYP